MTGQTVPFVETSSRITAVPERVAGFLMRPAAWTETSGGRLSVIGNDLRLALGSEVHGDLRLAGDVLRWDGTVTVADLLGVGIDGRLGGASFRLGAAVRPDLGASRLRVGIETAPLGRVRGSLRERQQVRGLQSIVEAIVAGVRERTMATELAGSIDLRDPSWVG